LIDRFVEHKEAVEDGRAGHAKALETEIKGLLREKEEIQRWAVAGSA
jgi:hypothetical protein